jgi:hypothetical protein
VSEGGKRCAGVLPFTPLNFLHHRRKTGGIDKRLPFARDQGRAWGSTGNPELPLPLPRKFLSFLTFF